MNRFAEYTRSASFRIELSEAMIRALLYLYLHEKPLPDRNFQSYDSLARRGLVEWVGEHLHPKARPLKLTGPGKLVALLLIDAGHYSIPELKEVG